MQNPRGIRGSKWSNPVNLERILVQIVRVWARLSHSHRIGARKRSKTTTWEKGSDRFDNGDGRFGRGLGDVEGEAAAAEGDLVAGLNLGRAGDLLAVQECAVLGCDIVQLALACRGE